MVSLQLVDLCLHLHGNISHNVVCSALLVDGSVAKIDAKATSNNRWTDLCDVIMQPGKDVSVPMQKCDEVLARC